jgi:hypothetical protein
VAAHYNKFAHVWASAVADWMSVFNLLFSWQLTFDVIEQTRGRSADDVMRQNSTSRYPKDWFDTHHPKPRTITRAPDLESRFAVERPIFEPYRLWAPHTFGLTEAQAQIDVDNAQRREQREANEAARLAAEAARKAERLAARAQQIADLRAEWLRTSVPNPDAPWDYRNWTRSEYWLVELKEPVNLEFVKRTLDVPSELDALQEIFGTGGGKAASEVKEEGESDANKELMRSVLKKKRLPSRAWLVRWVAQKAGEETRKYVDERVGEVIQTYTRPIEEHDPVYSDRNFWPNDGED